MPVNTELFQGIGDESRDALLKFGQRLHFAAGEVLFHQGSPSTEIILILKGKVKIWRVAPDGSSITLSVIAAGAPIGTLHAVDEMPHTATATALVPTEVLSWPLDPMRAIMRNDPVLTANVLSVVTRYAALMIMRLEEVSTIPVEGRIARALCRAADAEGRPKDGVEISLLRQDIADMSSTTLPTVSRIMSRWREKGLIDGYRGRVRILDSRTLCALAGWSSD